MMISPSKTPVLAKMAMFLLFAIGAVAVFDTNTISAQELGKTITSPFGIASQTSTSESGSDGDTFVDPETGEVGHIIRNPFGVANPEGVDTGIDIPDDAGEEVGGIITSPFGVPASDDIDTGVDVIDEDEEYLISLPDEEESEAEEFEDVDEVDDETSDDAKAFEEESEETTTEKVLPVIDNPIPRNEGPTCYFHLEGTSGEFSVTSDQSQNGLVPTLYVLQNANCTITAYGEFTSGNPQWLIKRANSTLVSLSNQTGALTYSFISNSNGSYGRTFMVLCRTTGDDPQERAIRISIVDGIKVFDPKLEGFTAPEYTVNPEIQKIAICNSQNLVVDTCSVANNGHFSWNGRWGENINGTDTEHKGKYADPGKYSFRVVKNNNVTSEIVLSVFIVRLGVQAIKFIDSIPYQYHKTTMLNNTNYSVDTSNSSTYNWRISALDFLKPNDEARPRTEAKKARPPVGECFDDTNNSGKYEASEKFYEMDGIPGVFHNTTTNEFPKSHKLCPARYL